MADPFQISLSGWVIQDGNYDDMCVGQEVRFALEFGIEDFQPSADRRVRSVHLGQGAYDATWQVVLQRESVTVVDFGLMAFRQGLKAPQHSEGDWQQGRLWLGVDPFFYSAELARNNWMPPLTYHWRIHEIVLDTTPRILAEDPSVPGIDKRAWIRDPARRASRIVQRTDAWNHEDAEYILVCEKLPDEPTRGS